MALKLAILLCVFAAATANFQPTAIKENLEEQQSRKFENYAQDALGGVYTECFAELSFPCLQRKVLSFVHRMSRMEQFDVLGQYLSVVKVRDEPEPESEFQARVLNAEQGSDLDQLMETTIDRLVHFLIPLP